jgi:hypothetical protein
LGNNLGSAHRIPSTDLKILNLVFSYFSYCDNATKEAVASVYPLSIFFSIPHGRFQIYQPITGTFHSSNILIIWDEKYSIT